MNVEDSFERPSFDRCRSYAEKGSHLGQWMIPAVLEIHSGFVERQVHCSRIGEPLCDFLDIGFLREESLYGEVTAVTEREWHSMMESIRAT